MNEPVATPPGVVTVTVFEPVEFDPGKWKVAVIVVEFTTVTPETFTPPLTATEVPAVVKFVPVRVTETLVPCVPLLGLTWVRVGVPGATTVNETGFVFPSGVATMMDLLVSAAVGCDGQIRRDFSVIHNGEVVHADATSQAIQRCRSRQVASHQRNRNGVASCARRRGD